MVHRLSQALISLRWQEAAVDKYLELTAVSVETPYCEAVEKAGFRDIFEKGVPGEILKEVNDRIQKDYAQ